MNESNINALKQSYKRIVVPVDGSNLSVKAAKLGCLLAKISNKKLIFIHVAELPATALPHGDGTYVPEISQSVKEHGKAILNGIMNNCSDDTIDMETKLLEGIPHNQINSFTNKDDLVIMGSKGHSAVERVLIGSVSENVLHHSDASVMIIR